MYMVIDECLCVEFTESIVYDFEIRYSTRFYVYISNKLSMIISFNPSFRKRRIHNVHKNGAPIFHEKVVT